MGPGELEGRPELGHEMAHAGLAARQPVGEEGAHRRPAQPRAVADGVVDLVHGGEVIGDQPQRLAPQRLEQAVGDEAVDLVADDDGVHGDRPVGRHRSRHRLRRGALRGAHLHQRQQVDRVEGMADDEALGALHLGGEPRGQQARGGRGDDRVGWSRLAGLGQQGALELLALRGALLDQVDPGHGLLDGVHDGERALGGHGGEGEPPPGAPASLDGVEHSARGVRRWIEQAHVHAVQHEARGPAAADDPGAEQADSAGRVSHGRAARAAPGPPQARARGRSSR